MIIRQLVGLSQYYSAARAQAGDRVQRIALLTPNQIGVRAMRQFNLPELAKLGFIEGRSISVQAGYFAQKVQNLSIGGSCNWRRRSSAEFELLSRSGDMHVKRYRCVAS